jgi:hypothetical protein
MAAKRRIDHLAAPVVKAKIKAALGNAAAASLQS